MQRANKMPIALPNLDRGTLLRSTARRLIWMLFIVMLLLRFAPASAQTTIDRKRETRVPIRADLKWENLTDGLQHVAGAIPRFNRAYKLSVVDLPPGAMVDFQVPEHEMIRVAVCSAGTIAPDSIQIWTSNGTGLFRQLKSAVATDGLSMVAAPDDSGISIGRIAHSPAATSAITVAIFTSARHTRRSLDYYQCDISCDQKRVKISDDRGRTPRYYTPLKSGHRYPLEVQGSTRLRLETRLKYDLDASQHQFYWVKIFVDGLYHKTLLFDTLPQRMHREFVSGTERLLGGREFEYLDIENDCESVEIELSHPGYVRADAIGLNLCNPLTNSRFNFPGLEKQSTDEDSWLDQEWVDDDRTLDDYLHGDEIELTKQPDPLWDPYLNYPRLIDVARNNNVPHGGLRAYMWIRAMAARRSGESDFGDEVSFAELVDRIKNRFTYFRDFPPVEVIPTASPRRVGFPIRSIRRPTQVETETIVGEQHILEAAQRLPTTTLYPLATGSDPTCGCGGLRFRPQRSLGRTIIRWIIDRRNVTSQAKIQVQYDNRPPVVLTLEPNSALPIEAFVPGRAEAALASLSVTHRRYDSGPWGGPFASLDHPVAMIQPGICEMILPSDVSQVSITATSDADDRIDVGCQILVAGYTELSESAYLKHSRHASTTPELKQFSRQQLDNNSIDVQRLLNSHISQFSSGVAAGNQLSGSQDVWSIKRLEQQRTAALRAADMGNWPGVMEHLTAMIHHSKPQSQQQRDAIITRTELLDHAGETFLANRERRGWLLHAQHQPLKTDLLEKLLEQTSNRPNEAFNRENILAAGATEIANTATEIQLAQQMANNGRYRFAFLSIPPDARGDEVEELRLRCCFQLRWWRSFKEAQKRVTDPQQRNFWGGIKLLQLGKYKRAFKLLAAAGDRGQQWIKHWRFGDHIYARLTSPDFFTRMSAIEDWERYLSKTPGPVVKKPAPAVVKSCYGAATVYSPARDLHFETFTSLQSAPATIAVHGPVRIQIESRPLHSIESSEAINGVVEIVNGGQRQIVPLINNQASDTLEIEGRENEVLPGTKVIAELELPAGLNEISIGSPQTDLIHRVTRWHPEIASPVLPPINETTIAAVILGKLGNTHQPQLPPGYQGRVGTDRTTPDLVRLISRDVGGRSLAHGFIEFDGSELELAEIVPRLTQQMGDLPAWKTRISPSYFPVKLLHQDATYQKAIAILYDDDPTSDVLDEGNETPSKLRKIAALETLLQQHPQHRELHRLLTHAKSGASWKRMEQFDRRAGVYLERVTRWRPDNPAIRFRKSLQGNLNPQRAILGDDPLILDLTSIFATEVEISLQRPRVGFLPTADTTVMWQIGEQQDQITLKSHDQIETFRVKIVPQNNQISLWMPQPYANHFVHVNVHEVLPDGTVDHDNDLAASLGSVTRTYHVATTEEPLRFRIAGPNVIRVDQLVDNPSGATANEEANREIITQIIPVTADNRTFELVPAAGQKLARYRIYEIDMSQDASPIYRAPAAPRQEPSHWIDSKVADVFAQIDQDFTTDDLDLLGLRSPDADHVDVTLTDPSRLGLQESGTTGLHLGFRSRRPLDEFLVDGEPGQFFETGLTNQYYDPWRNQYRKTEFLIRPRLGSGPTFGFRHGRFNSARVIDDAPDESADSWGPLNSNWNVYAFGQHAGTPLVPGANSFPWTAGFSGSLSRKHFFSPNLSHRPSIGVRARFLSEDVNGFAPGELDQDIFTQYKRDHRYGLRISDTFAYQRYLDRRIYLRPLLIGNEDQLIPDNIGFEVGSDQLLGPVELHVDYRLTGFLADNDRTGASIQNVFSLDLKSEHWHHGGHRSEIDFSVRYAVDGGTSVGLFLNHYFNDGRGYRDFNPSSILFRSLKQERAAKINHFRPD